MNTNSGSAEFFIRFGLRSSTVPSFFDEFVLSFSGTTGRIHAFGSLHNEREKSVTKEPRTLRL